jgi:predicted nucleotidyltransferase
MSVVGFGEAAEHCNAIEIEKGLYVQVACIPSLALLKLHAYLDRRARGLSKDIQDFDWFLRHYDLVPGHELRIHEELRELLIASEIESSTAGAMLLGTDLARVHSRSALEPLEGLLAEFGDPFGRPVEDVLRTYAAPDEAQERAERARIRARLDAFVRGLSFGSRTQQG